MVDIKTVQSQLKTLKFGGSPFNQAEMRELPKILHDGEKISECANGIYEGGFALLVATDQRLLLIDKKPFNYMNVEDLRFDMISEIDYSHRMVGATIIISAGNKTLRFKSYNQPRLRNLINLVQERMSSNKKEQAEKANNQQQHLEEINKQLQMYLLAQQQQLQQQIRGQQAAAAALKPSPQLSDYLFAQRLMEEFQRNNGIVPPTNTEQALPSVSANVVDPPTQAAAEDQNIVADAKQEVFGKAMAAAPTGYTPVSDGIGLEINPLRIAYSKLPMMLRNRKFGRPSLHAHSQQMVTPSGRTQTAS